MASAAPLQRVQDRYEATPGLALPAHITTSYGKTQEPFATPNMTGKVKGCSP